MIFQIIDNYILYLSYYKQKYFIMENLTNLFTDYNSEQIILNINTNATTNTAIMTTNTITDSNSEQIVLNTNTAANNVSVDVITETLGERMKKYEAEHDYEIPPYHAIIVRSDGHDFSSLTRNCEKPCDVNFTKAMVKTMKDTVEHVNARTGYTHSDEITLIFAPTCTFEEYQNSLNGGNPVQKHIYNGRIQKIVSLISAYCSVRFNEHFKMLINSCSDKYNDRFIKLVNSNIQIFDCRILDFPPDKIYEVVNHQIWRSVCDSETNATNSFAQKFIGQKKIIGKKCSEMKIMLLEYGIDWLQIPIWIKHGIYCKKILFETEINGKICTRSNYVFKKFKINFSPENIDMLLNKFWTNYDDKIELEEFVF